MADDLTEALGKNIPLSEMIESLRQELAVAIDKGKGQAVGFVVEGAELEVELVAKRTTSGGGGVKFWVVTAEGKAEVGDEVRHRLKLALTPKMRPTPNEPEGGPVNVSR